VRPLLPHLELDFAFSLSCSLGTISLALRSILLGPLDQRLLPATSRATIGSTVTLLPPLAKLQPHLLLTQFCIGLGPVLGASLGAGVYKILLLANYQTVNPGQDDDGLSIVRYEITHEGTTSRLADESV